MPSLNFTNTYYYPLLVTQFDPITGETNDIPSAPGRIREVIFEKSWVRTPNWKSVSRNQKWDLPMNDFHYYKKVTKFPVSSCTLYEYAGSPAGLPVYYRYDYNGAIDATALGAYTYPGGVDIPTPVIDFDLVDQLAKRQHLLDLKDQKVNLVQAYAERHQTVRLFQDAITRSVGAVTALKRGNFAAAARSLGVRASPRRIRKYKKGWASNQSDAVASGWLELKYGWQPLLQDIYGSAESIAQKQVREVRNRVVTKLTRKSMTMGSSPQLQYGGVIKSSSELRYSVKYTSYFTTSEGIHTPAQMGITNPALIAWELTPWSFVVDWFIPIGNYISSWDATLGLTFQKGCRTTFKKLTLDSRRFSGPGAGWPYPDILVANHGATMEEVTVNRGALSAFPNVQLPSFKSPISGVHIANALALLKTAFLRK